MVFARDGIALQKWARETAGLRHDDWQSLFLWHCELARCAIGPLFHAASTADHVRRPRPIVVPMPVNQQAITSVRAV